jgi:BASS family bile acid:Na+ symporter
LKVKKKKGISFLYTCGMRDGIIPLGVAITYFSVSATLASTLMRVVMPFIVAGVYYVISRF